MTMTGKKKWRTPCIRHLVIARCMSCKLEKRVNFYFYFVGGGGCFLDIKRNVLLLVVVVIPRGRQPFRGGKDSTGSKIGWLLIPNAKRQLSLTLLFKNYPINKGGWLVNKKSYQNLLLIFFSQNFFCF